MPNNISDDPIRVSVHRPRQHGAGAEVVRTRNTTVDALERHSGNRSTQNSVSNAPAPPRPDLQQQTPGVRGALDAAERKADFGVYAETVHGDDELRNAQMGCSRVAARLGHTRALTHFLAIEPEQADLFEDVVAGKAVCCVKVLRDAGKQPSIAALEQAVSSDHQSLIDAVLASAHELPLTLKDYAQSVAIAHKILDRERREGDAHLAAFAHFDDVDLIERLVRRGATVTNAAVMAAVEADKTQMLRYLLAHGGSPDAVGTGLYRLTALQQACRNGNIEAVQMLLAAGGDPHAIHDQNTASCLGIAAYGEHQDIVELLQGTWAETLRSGARFARDMATHPVNVGGTGGALAFLGILKAAGAFSAAVVAAEGLPFVIVGGVLMGAVGYLGGASVANVFRRGDT